MRKAIELNRAVIIAPIIGFETNMDDFPAMNSIFSEIEREESIDPNIFKSNWLLNFEFKGSFRALVVKPNRLQILDLADDEHFPGKKKIKLEMY